MKLTYIKNESGLVTIIALLMVGMLTLIGIAALTTSDDEVEIAGNEMHDVRAFYAAEAGLEQAAAAIETEYERTGIPPALLPHGGINVNEYEVTYVTEDDGVPTPQILTNGSLTGLHATVKSFSITTTASDVQSRSSVQMTQTFEAALVPIFQFAVFYENDLEIAPGPDMDVIGRVHTNGDLYIQSDNTLKLESYMTAAGDIIHGRKGPGGVGTGDVLIKDVNGVFQSMKDASGYLDSQDSYWLDSSVVKWRGTVQDAAHGQEALSVPLTGAGGPHKLIEREAGNPESFETKATLKYIDGDWFSKQGGVWQDVTAGMTAAGITVDNDNKFYDGREKKDVDVVDLDVGALQASIYAPQNGIIYFSETPISGASGDFPALRLNNGSNLGSPLTVASENPVYTVGDYNVVNKQPASILADAVTFLSSAWNDTKGKNPKVDRTAVPTTVNASYLTGNVETTASDYNGGFENLPRFLEDWSGTDFTWAGSGVNLWTSLQANGIWNSSVYSPPNRKWSYDPDLDDPANMPPGAPSVRVFQRTGWKQEHVGFSQVYEVVKGTGKPN